MPADRAGVLARRLNAATGLKASGLATRRAASGWTTHDPYRPRRQSLGTEAVNRPTLTQRPAPESADGSP